jgi:Putative GTPase activating protein for Arf
MDPDVPVDVTYRDSVFKKLKQIPENLFCFDCNLKNPSWCSVILGIFICYNCATPHRSMGTHLSFVRSSELDMWTLRQLSYLECGGNKKVKSFFRTHGVQANVDYTSQIAERWRNELSETVLEIYPKKSSIDPILPETVQTPNPVEEQKSKPEEKLEEKEEKTVTTVKLISPILPRTSYQLPTTEVKHRFKKTKVEENQSVSFKPVTFKAQTDEEEFFDPQPLKAPPKPKIEIVPTPAPVQRKPVEKKAISSEDYEAMYVDERANKARIAQFSSASAISSDMFFGREEPKNIEIGSEKLKEEASKIGAYALNKATKVISN